VSTVSWADREAEYASALMQTTGALGQWEGRTCHFPRFHQILIAEFNKQRRKVNDICSPKLRIVMEV